MTIIIKSKTLKSLGEIWNLLLHGCVYLALVTMTMSCGGNNGGSNAATDSSSIERDGGTDATAPLDSGEDIAATNDTGQEDTNLITDTSVDGMAEDSASEDDATADTATGDIAAVEDIATDDTGAEDISTAEDITTDDSVSEDIATDDSVSEDIATDDSVSEDVTTDTVAQDTASSDTVTQDLPIEEPCGEESIPANTITGTEGLAMAQDGTLYFSQSGRVGIRRPSMPAQPNWVTLAGASTVWGLALRDDGILFVASPSGGGRIYRIDTQADNPQSEIIRSGAGSANGATIGPDGLLYYSDFNGGRVYQLTDGGDRTQVTTSPIPSANGLFFDDDGSLLVLSYSSGQIWRLVLSNTYIETERTLVATVQGALDGIAKDESGRYYVSDNGNGRLLRFNENFQNQEVLLTGVAAAANIVFGRGQLHCHDIHVASAGQLGLFRGDSPGRP